MFKRFSTGFPSQFKPQLLNFQVSQPKNCFPFQNKEYNQNIKSKDHQSGPIVQNSHHLFHVLGSLLPKYNKRQQLFNKQNKMEYQSEQGPYVIIQKEQIIKNTDWPLIRFIQETDYEYPEQESPHKHMHGIFVGCARQEPEQVHPQAQNIPAPPSNNISESVKKPQKNKRRSLFHNFQKHLCTFLARVIKIQLKQTNTESSSSEKCAFDLWNHFLKAHYFTKKKLYSLLGITINNKQIKPTFKRGKKQKSLHNYSLSELKEGQLQLRNIITSQCIAFQKNQLMTVGKMKKIDEFYNYFRLFVQDLTSDFTGRPISMQRFMTQSQQGTRYLQ